ncbi:MAG: hypothetical protein O3B64_02925 [bacterium]|nr:hypothetical protein [bacterium]MDA1024576.1 hypothetical protein [bacterium]
MQFTGSLRNIALAGIATAIALAAFFAAAPSQVQAVTPLSEIEAGDLIRSVSNSAVYYMGADERRYVFTNDRNYFTWYDNFDDVITISDIDITKTQIGGNVTYRPGVKMVKIVSDPTVYAVSTGGTLHSIDSEAVATNLYGSSWNTKIDDLADAFFASYTIGSPLTLETDYNPETVMNAIETINTDKNLRAPEGMNITDSAFSPIDVTIEVGQVVRFTNTGSTPHSVTADDLTWGSGTLQPGENFIKQFNEEDVYTFFDSYNGTATGAVYVELSP